ncbi:translation initiation factor eIF 4e-like domain-containing protein [Irpex rosettiformis]|uniref:Translation initiation factor eIF 4e-like domain-containing protein n=1 Tax=Irpex rosettiformis TaxID=378272 RepID=A0ACB8U8V4_9APHY|nr:translation initiation factor eIF 4e-like domain-containing protein [Irpex rosettiformis]
MGAAEDDKRPNAETYPYFWHAKSEITLQDFHKKYKPSMVQDDGTKPWLWVEKSVSEEEDMDKAEEEAIALLEEVTEKVESIKNDDSIPVRANKKKGLKSKKELREEIQTSASEKLKDISIRHHCVSGKWLIFASPDKVDLIWSNLATSLIEGPLASTSATLAKVSTSPKDETQNYQHVMCLYMPDVYDQDKVTEVMKVLLRNHGMNLMGVKSNLYTAIGLDSKHASGIQSTVWKNSALMKETEIKACMALKDEFYAEVNKAKSTSAEKKAEGKSLVQASSDTKGNPKLLKKVTKTNIFSSDDEDDKLTSKPSGDSTKSIAGQPTSKKQTVQEFTSDAEDDSEIEARKQELRAKKSGKKPPERKRSRAKSTSSEDEEDHRPSKAVKRGNRK